MNIQELKLKSSEQLITQAEELDIENASTRLPLLHDMSLDERSHREFKEDVPDCVSKSREPEKVGDPDHPQAHHEFGRF